ncbi:aldehyde reductase [Mariniphaga sediminis]|uniref:Aldehyde reductase n=1 Tax=Mariniphaga sediminis TaxID=1628158 RepID=A0A399D9N2_9BACT|nr:aldehyde reductase [Mariniphaga sediminis]RIH67002.1 aldehyde reductase [Mariniphaga sediminis]
MEKTKGKVLLTGITGFVGLHTAIQLLKKNYEVVGTLRNINRADTIKKIITKHTYPETQKLSFEEADLTDKNIWKKLTADVDFVQHIASPFPRELPKDENELIIPAYEGTLNILEAASAANVKRVVLTSSMAAVAYGKEKKQRSGTFNESHWTNDTNKKDTTPYFRSKTIAEKAAWDFMNQEKNGLELSTICPGAILGPVLGKDFGTSANIVIKMLDGSFPALPDIGFEIVDVRSVADLLIRAMEVPEAANERFIGSAGFLKLRTVAQMLKEAYPEKKIPSKVLPNFMIRLFATFDKSVQPVLIDLGLERKVDNSKAKKLLGWEPLPNHEAVLSCAESVIKLRLTE